MLILMLVVNSQAPAFAQDQFLIEGSSQELVGEGWRGFTDYDFLFNAFLAMSLATALGAVIAYHPKSRRILDSLEEAEASKTFLMYAVVGAIIGILVLKYGLVIGFVIFGIGGLMRFRTDVGSAPHTGRVIFVTLVGLACGLDLPHVAVLATTFGFILIYLLDARIIYRLIIKGVRKEVLVASANAYRHHLEAQRCHILHENKNFKKARIVFVFRTSNQTSRDELEHVLQTHVSEELRGAIDWDVN